MKRTTCFISAGADHAAAHARIGVMRCSQALKLIAETTASASETAAMVTANVSVIAIAFPLRSKDAPWGVNERQTRTMKQTVLGAEPDEEDQSRRKEKSGNADGRCEDENEEPLHNRLHTMAAVKEGKSQTVKLPWPPSTNSLWRSVRGKVVRSEGYKTWWDAAGWELAAQRPQKHRGPVRLSIRLRSPTKQAYDPDNRLKACLDLLKALHVIEADDNRIVRSITVEVSDTGEPGAKIEVTPI